MIQKILKQIIKEEIQNKSKLDLVVSKLQNKTNLKEILDDVEVLDLPFLGRGETRITFEINDDWVLKVANKKGIQFNKIEANPKIKEILGDHSLNIAHTGPDYIWIIVEGAISILESSIDSLETWWKDAGIPPELFYNKKFIDYIGGFLDVADKGIVVGVGVSMLLDDPNCLNKFLGKENIEAILNTDLFQKFKRLKSELNILPTDFHEGNVGYTKTGRPVIIDLGFGPDES